eukprot:1857394-Rhodomonas_salina.1
MHTSQVRSSHTKPYAFLFRPYNCTWAVPGRGVAWCSCPEYPGRLLLAPPRSTNSACAASQNILLYYVAMTVNPQRFPSNPRFGIA